MTVFWGKISSREAGGWTKRITKSAFQNDVDLTQETEDERKKWFVEGKKFYIAVENIKWKCLIGSGYISSESGLEAYVGNPQPGDSS